MDAGGSRKSDSKRQKDDHSLVMKKLIISVLNEQVFKLEEPIIRELRHAEGEQTIIQTLLSCIEAFPTKTATYALLMGALANNDQTRPVAVKVLVACGQRIQRGDTRKERLCLKFLAASIKACGIESKFFFEVLDSLVGENSDDEESEVGRSKESQVFTVLSTIPFVACSSSASRIDETEEEFCSLRLRELCDRLSRVRRVSALPARLASLPQAQKDRTDPASDRVAMGLAMVTQTNFQAMQDTEFDSLLIASAPQLPRFGEFEFQEVNEALKEVTLRIELSLKEPQNEIDDSFSSTLLPLFPDGQPLDPLQLQVSRKPSLIETFLTREYALDILGSYHPKASEAAEALLALNSPYIIIESIFSSMLQMPKPEHSLLYYSEVLIKLCMKDPNNIPAVIEDALDQILLLEPEAMDPDTMDRISSWLLNHVIEFELDWPWIKWKGVYSLDPKRSVRCLVEQVMQRLDAFGFSKQMFEAAHVPKDLFSFLPDKSKHISPYFPSRLGEDVVSLIQTSPSAGQLGSFLEEQAPQPDWNTDTRTRLIIHAALFSDKAGYSCMVKNLEKIGKALLELARNVDEEEERIVSESALKAALDFWGNNPVFAVYAIGAIVDVGICSLSVALKFLAEMDTEKNSSLRPYWKRRAMEDVLARFSSKDAKRIAIEIATSSDIDEATDLWLSRKKS